MTSEQTGDSDRSDGFGTSLLVMTDGLARDNGVTGELPEPEELHSVDQKR